MRLGPVALPNKRTRYFDLDLPELLDTLQSLHGELLDRSTNMVQSVADSTKGALAKMSEAQNNLVHGARGLNGDHDVSVWMGTLGSLAETGVEDLEYKPPTHNGTLCHVWCLDRCPVIGCGV
jgi:hypothetical protein